MDGLTMHITEGSPSVLRVGGELDLATAEPFVKALEHALAADSSVIVDLADVTFIDAAGLHAILRAAESRGGDGPLTLVNASRVIRLLEVAGVDGFASIAIREEQIGRAG
jgi:anti-anti-sigma factor